MVSKVFKYYSLKDINVLYKVSKWILFNSGESTSSEVLYWEVVINISSHILIEGRFGGDD